MIDYEVITSDGDVILLIGPSKDRLRVSSQVLSTTSPVFKAMLGPNFREGQQPRSSAQPVDIPLPEDDHDSMWIMCSLLHHCNIDWADYWSFHPLSILQTITAMEKYQVMAALNWPMRGLLSSWLFDNTTKDTIRGAAGGAAAAYRLYCGASFERATAQYINECQGGIAELIDKPEITSVLPLEVLLILEERRIKAQAKSDQEPKDEGLCLGCVSSNSQDRHKRCGGGCE